MSIDPPAAHTFWSNLYVLLGRRDVLRFGVLGIFLAINSLVELLSLASVPAFVSLLLGGNGSGFGIPHGVLQRFGCINAAGEVDLLRAGAGVVALYGVRALWMYLTVALKTRMLANRRVELSTRILSCYLADFTIFAVGERSASDLVNRAVNESERTVRQVINPLLEISCHAIILLCVGGMLLWQMPLMATAAIGALGIFGGGYMYLNNRGARTAGRNEQQCRTRALALAGEALGTAVESAMAQGRGYMDQRFATAMSGVATARRSAEIRMYFIWPYLEFVALVVMLGVFLMALRFTPGGVTAVAPGIALLGVALVRLRTTVISLMSYWEELRFNRAALDAVADDLRRYESASGNCRRDFIALDRQPAVPLKELLRVEELSFAYPGSDKQVLQKIDLTIHPGEMIGLAGASGCGKSTLLMLLAGVLTPTAGKITVDGRDLQEVGAGWLHSAGYVPQKPVLIDGSVSDNIALGVPKEARDVNGLTQAAAAAGLEEFLAQLPQGIETPIGDDGARLSGGQRQRIAIARALYRNPQMLFLDEATSALDTTTEKEFSQSLWELGNGSRTVVIVAHRLGTLRRCQRIYFLAAGEVLSSGSWDELYRNCPEFREMADNATIAQ